MEFCLNSVQDVSARFIAAAWQKSAVTGRHPPALRELPLQIIDPRDVTLDGISQHLVFVGRFAANAFNGITNPIKCKRIILSAAKGEFSRAALLWLSRAGQLEGFNMVGHQPLVVSAVIEPNHMFCLGKKQPADC